ncbi:MAG: 4-hydroxy-tetrahydrodipicolinate reductase [Actinomycetota bacterium]
MTSSVAIVGATGRMGQLVSRLVEHSDDFDLVARLDSTSPLADMLAADLVVDVTVPAASQAVVDFAVGHGKSVLVGTSGWSATRITSLENRMAAEGTGAGVIIIPNFSVGSVLATSFAAMAAPFYDSIEIIEAHHSTKVDSPSGTAVHTAELIGNARSALGPVIATHADQRARGQQVSSVPIHSLRMQGIVAKQDVIFGGIGEILTVSHQTLEASAYESGMMLALRALGSTTGVVVGLDRLIRLGPADPPRPPDIPNDLE